MNKSLSISMIVFMAVLILNIIILQSIKADFKPLGNNYECSKQIYQSYALGSVVNSQYANYEYIVALTLNDTIKECSDLEQVKEVFELTVNIKQGNTKIIDELSHYRGNLNRLEINNMSHKEVEIDLYNLPKDVQYLEFSQIEFKNGEEFKQFLNREHQFIIIKQMKIFDFKWIDTTHQPFALRLENIDQISASSPLNHKDLSLNVHIINPGMVDFEYLSEQLFYQLALTNVSSEVINELGKLNHIYYLTIKDSDATDLTPLLEIEQLAFVSIDTNMAIYGNNPEVIKQLEERNVYFNYQERK